MPSDFDPTPELRDHFRRQRSAADRHPSPEQLVAFHEDRLSPQELEAVREHLAACPDCTTQLLALAEPFEGDEGEPEEVSPADVDAAWQRQRERLFPGAEAPPLRWRFSPLQKAWGTAAALGLAAALLSFVVVRQGLDLARLRQPQLNPPLVNLEPSGLSRQPARVAELQFPAGAERAWVILNTQARLPDSFYDIHVVAPDGKVVHRFESVPKSEKSNFRIEIPRGLLPAGTYSLMLVAQGRRIYIVDQFDLRVIE
jgi:anti-sigma factor RsiW